MTVTLGLTILDPADPALVDLEIGSTVEIPLLTGRPGCTKRRQQLITITVVAVRDDETPN